MVARAFSTHPGRQEALAARVPTDRPRPRADILVIQLDGPRCIDLGVCPECGCCNVYDWDDGLGPRCAGLGCDHRDGREPYDHCVDAMAAREAGQGHATRDDARAGWSND